MAAGKLQAPRGTFDVLPADAHRRDRLVEISAGMLEGAGYARTETPVFEDTAVFARGVGESTDIVQKEMFTFEDQGGRSLTLRPENTAGICRAYIEHGMHKLPQPVKLWSWGPFFRHEAPQAGRYRQFTQLDAEALGSDDPSLDAELIVLLAQILERSGVKTRLLLSSLGNADTRAEYGEELRAHLRAHESDLSDEVRSRMDTNPLRAFDSDHPGTRAAMAEAPRLVDRLDSEDTTHFAEVRALLEEAGCAYELDPTLVRGLDYYTRTVFEFASDDLGAQSGVGGGGRYDGLVEKLGGPSTPGVGWAAGVERILLASQATPERSAGTRAYVVVAKADERAQAFGLVNSLRAAGVTAEMEQAGRSFKGQMKQADRVGATHVVIVGDSVEVKDMATGNQREVASLEDAVRAVIR
ncbi:MAG: histidine--tRNA ligase [Thermoleophilaceae bacterium]|jgi:histidyl-tRNA synthetase|nr:histidine--tRNA ligase [Thermoleophilaceae bacterium]